VIGISTTAERFRSLVGDTTSTLQKYIVKASDVCSSGLLKDRIVITYPGDPENNNEMAVLDAATDEWVNKCRHWHQYCYEQHYAYEKNCPFPNAGSAVDATPSPKTNEATVKQINLFETGINCEGVIKFINDLALLTYIVRSVNINSYLKSLLNLASLLTQNAIDLTAKQNLLTPTL
jgi:hypothetical protein